MRVGKSRDGQPFPCSSFGTGRHRTDIPISNPYLNVGADAVGQPSVFAAVYG